MGKAKQEEKKKIIILSGNEQGAKKIEDLLEPEEIKYKYIEKLEENVEELTDDNLDETKNSETNVKKIKILNKEFNYEDVILVLMGIVIVAAIFLMPKIMSMFK
mgnify:CR=1 FL=1